MTEHDLKEMKNLGAELGAAKAEVERLRAILEGILFCGRGTSGRIILDAEDEDRIRGALMQAGPERICPCQFGNCLGAEDDEVCKAKQAEPTDTYTAVDMATAAAQGFRDGQAAVEKAPTQDEREAFEARMVLEAGPGAADLWIKGNPSAGYSNERVNDHRFGWVACLEWMATRPAQTEQQPEQSGLSPELLRRVLAALDQGATAFKAVNEVRNEFRAALSAQGTGKFAIGDRVKKTSGSEWVGHVCGTYSTSLTPEGYAVESEAHAGSVQIYPVTALEAVE